MVIVFHLMGYGTQPLANRLQERLMASLGAQALVGNVAQFVRPGDDYFEAIRLGVQRADAMLVVIGADWVDALIGAAPNDFNRFALEQALASNVRVVPILLENATLPPVDLLPAPLAPIARRQGVRLTDEWFEQEVVQILDIVRPTPAPPAPSTPLMSAGVPQVNFTMPQWDAAQLENLKFARWGCAGILGLLALVLTVGYFFLPFVSFTLDSMTDAVADYRDANRSEWNENVGEDVSPREAVRDGDLDDQAGCQYTAFDMLTNGKGNDACEELSDEGYSGEDEDWSTMKQVLEASLLIYPIGGLMIGFLTLAAVIGGKRGRFALYLVILIALALYAYLLIFDVMYGQVLKSDVKDNMDIGDFMSDAEVDRLAELTSDLFMEAMPAPIYMWLPWLIIFTAGGILLIDWVQVRGQKALAAKIASTPTLPTDVT